MDTRPRQELPRQAEDARQDAPMSTIVLRAGVVVDDPLERALELLGAYPTLEACDLPRSSSFDHGDLRLANRGGARISAAEAAAILERRSEIERRLREIEPEASLAGTATSMPWIPLTRLFDAFADIRGVGFSKMTKALHPKRPALIPMLDSVVQAYLAIEDPEAESSGSFGERAGALVHSYKRDLDRNHDGLREIQRDLSSRGRALTEVRILDLLIWSESRSEPWSRVGRSGARRR
jgi:hypothetical protein